MVRGLKSENISAEGQTSTKWGLKHLKHVILAFPCSFICNPIEDFYCIIPYIGYTHRNLDNYKLRRLTNSVEDHILTFLSMVYVCSFFFGGGKAD